MKFNRIVLVSILLLIFAIGAVSAADENMTDTAEEVLSAEPTEDLEATQRGTFSQLSTLVSNTSSGETLYLENDYVNFESSGKVIISNEITIDGQGHTIDAKKKSNIFSVSNNKVVLKNINFINSYTKNYSAVYGKCTIINCTFTDCLSEKNGGAIYKGTAYNSSFINCKACSEDTDYEYYDYDTKLPPYCQGGAIYNGDAYNCYFENCYAEFIYEYEYYTWDDSHLTSGDSGRGGAISNGNAFNSMFNKCHSYMGGAIYNSNATDCSFITCSAERGGAIYNVNPNNCSFINCYANDGGAIYNGNATDCSFINCSARNGVIMAGRFMNDIYNCTFINCYSKVHGGAAYSCRAYDCAFINCSSAYGGAIYEGHASNCSFIDCHADSYKVGVYENGGEGGAIYGNYNQISASDCTFINCSTNKKGGAIIRGDAYNSRFINCTSGNNEIITQGKATNCTFIPFTFSCSNLTMNYGEGGKLPIRTVEGTNGIVVDVKIYKDNKLVNSFSSTTGSDLIIDAAPGNYIIALTCPYAKPQNVSVVVNKASPKMAFATDFAKSGETANIKVTMSKKATGYARIIINGETYRVPINSGVAIAEVPNLADGVYTVKATYSGNAYYVAETVTGTFQVGKADQGIELVTKNIKVGETERLIANLANDATGFVRFIIGEDTYRVAIENGVAYVDIKDLKVGTYSVTFKYGGNYRYNAETVSKTFTVSKSSPGIKITANSIIVGETATIKVNAANDVPGNVWITVNGESHKVKIENGVATLTLSGLKLGTYDISVKYNGNYKYNAETKTASFNVSKASPELKVYKTTVEGRTVLTANIAEDATGYVNFAVNGGTYKAKIVNGIATLTLPDMAPGTYTLKSSYGGNYKYLPETKTRTITIK